MKRLMRRIKNFFTPLPKKCNPSLVGRLLHRYNANRCWNCFNSKCTRSSFYMDDIVPEKGFGGHAYNEYFKDE